MASVVWNPDNISSPEYICFCNALPWLLHKCIVLLAFSIYLPRQFEMVLDKQMLTCKICFTFQVSKIKIMI